MALTDMSKIFKLERSEVAFIPNKRDAPKIGERIKLYVSRLMPNIPMGEPKETIICTRGTSVFKNAPECAIRADSSMVSANYIEVKFEGNTKWRTDKAEINEETGERKVEKGLKVICHAESDVVKDMTFSNK